MAISGNDLAITPARGAIARGGATRGGWIPDANVTLLWARSGYARSRATKSNYVNKLRVPVITIGGQATGSMLARRVLVASLSIQDALNEVPNTCTLTVQGTKPVEGMDVVITTGDQTIRWFAGTIIRVTQIYVVQKPGNVLHQVECVDWTWQLNSRLVNARYTAQSATAIATDLVTRFAPAGFSTTGIVAGLPIVDEISFTNTAVMDALAQLATRIGGYAFCDYSKVVQLFITAIGPNPADLVPTHPTLSDVVYTRDLSQIVTRAIVVGGGANALGAVAVGDTRIPIEDPSWYSTGLITTGQQRLSYTGVVTGGQGAIVGPGITPSAAPVATIASGTGLPTGTYQYAYTFMSATGETRPSPLAAVTLGPYAAPTQAPDLSDPGAGYNGGLVPNGLYRVRMMYAFDTNYPPLTYTTGGPISQMRAPNTGVLRITLYGAPDTRVRQVIACRTTDGGATYYQAESYTDLPPNTTYGTLATMSDSMLSSRAVMPGSTNANFNSVTISGIAVGPTGTTARRIYRTTVNGANLQLLATLSDNSTTAMAAPDTTPDGSLGAAPPASDTSGLSGAAGTVLPGATAMVVSSIGPFAGGGWAIVGSQLIRFTGASGNQITGIPASGAGAITAAINYGASVVVAAQITGIPASGAGAITVPVLGGDAVNVTAIRDDTAAQSALAVLMGGTGIVESVLTDNRISLTEANSRAVALLAQRSRPIETVRYRSHDPITRSGQDITVNLPAPTNIVGTFKIQDVHIGGFLGTDQFPLFDVTASSQRMSFEDLLRRQRTGS